MSNICRRLGRCAYDAANGEPNSGCEWWAECFGQRAVPTATEETP